MVDVSTKRHGLASASKVLAGIGGGHIYNVRLSKNHDNGELILRGGWLAFDEYEEKTGAITFEGVIRADSAEGGYYVEVTAPTDALFVYNTPVSPYGTKDLRDEHLFYNATGDTVKAYSLTVGDIVSVSEELFKNKIVLGKKVSFADGKYVVATA